MSRCARVALRGAACSASSDVRDQAEFVHAVDRPAAGRDAELAVDRNRLGLDRVPGEVEPFPDLPKRLGKIDGSLKLRVVNRFTARELVVTGPILTIAAKPRIEIECALIVWYKHQDATTAPVAVEFSFRYGNTNGRYSGKAARRAYNIFETLQHTLPEWLDPNCTTKTALVFG